MSEFESYGRVAPMAVQYKHTDPTAELDKQGLQMEFQHMDRMVQANEMKQQKMAALGSEISGKYNEMKQASFLNQEATARLNEDFLSAIELVGSHYTTPSSERDVAWHAQLDNMKSSLTPEIMVNDKKNQALRDKVMKLSEGGNISIEGLADWEKRFKARAENGEDFEEQAILNGEAVMPLSNNEQFLQKSTNHLDNSVFGANQLQLSGNGQYYTLKDDALKDWIVKNRGAFWDDAERNFDAIPAEYKTKIFPGWRDHRKEAIDQHIFDVLSNSYKINNAAYGRRFSGGGDPDEKLDPHKTYIKDDLLKGVMMNLGLTPILGATAEEITWEAITESYKKRNQEPQKDAKGNIINPTMKTHRMDVTGYGAFLGDTPTNDGQTTFVNYSADLGDFSYGLQIPLENDTQMDWVKPDNLASLPGDVIPTWVKLNDKKELEDFSATIAIDGAQLTSTKAMAQRLLRSSNGKAIGDVFDTRTLKYILKNNPGITKDTPIVIEKSESGDGKNKATKYTYRIGETLSLDLENGLDEYIGGEQRYSQWNNEMVQEKIYNFTSTFHARNAQKSNKYNQYMGQTTGTSTTVKHLNFTKPENQK